MADDDKEPNFWLTLLKLTVGAIVIITLVGLALYYSAKFDTYRPAKPLPDQSWGIFKDSPLRQPR